MDFMGQFNKIIKEANELGYDKSNLTFSVGQRVIEKEIVPFLRQWAINPQLVTTSCEELNIMGIQGVRDTDYPNHCRVYLKRGVRNSIFSFYRIIQIKE